MERGQCLQSPQSQVRAGKPAPFDGLEGVRRVKDKAEETNKFEEPGDSSVSGHACKAGIAEQLSYGQKRRSLLWGGGEEKYISPGRSQVSAVTEEI